MPTINGTINDGIENIVIDLSKLDEAGEDSVELVGEFAELIEEIGSPFKLAFVVQGEDAEMWKNLDGCEEAAAQTGSLSLQKRWPDMSYFD